MTNLTKFLRRSVLLAAVAALFALAAAASASAAPLAFVGNFEAASVSVFNTQTNAFVGEPIVVGEYPYSIAITPNGEHAYVTNFGSDTVSVIDTRTLRTVGEPIAVGLQPASIAISPDGKRAYVADLGDEEVMVIDTQTNKVVAEIEIGAEPAGIAVSPSGGSVWVTSRKAGTVEVIDVATNAVVGAPIEVGGHPETVVFTPDGKTAYIAGEDTGEEEPAEEVEAVDASTKVVTRIKVGHAPYGVAVTPDGGKAFVANSQSESVSVINTDTNQVIGEIPVGVEPYEVAIAPDGKTALVALFGAKELRLINTQTDQVSGPSTALPTAPFPLAITPDQSPTAAFTPPPATATIPTTFSGAGSTDPDGSISAFNWTFGDGGTGTGASIAHTYATAGTYNAKLSVVDNEGCGETEVFTGRTAYCSGSASASVTHPVTVNPVPNNFGFGRLIHNRRNGTVRLQVKLPGPGSVLLLGGKVHLVSKKIARKGSLWLVIHPRVEVNKRLKKVHHIRVKVRVKFTPTGGAPKTKTRSFQLLRARKKHHHHR